MGAVHTRNNVVSDAPMVTGTSSREAETELGGCGGATDLSCLPPARTQNPKTMPVMQYLSKMNRPGRKRAMMRSRLAEGSQIHRAGIVSALSRSSIILWPRPETK
jgi:hypothetical protein